MSERERALRTLPLESARTLLQPPTPIGYEPDIGAKATMAPTPIQRRACPGLWPTHNTLAQRPRLSCPLEPASDSRVNKSTYPDVLKAPLRIVDANGAGVAVPYTVQSSPGEACLPGSVGI